MFKDLESFLVTSFQNHVFGFSPFLKFPKKLQNFLGSRDDYFSEKGLGYPYFVEV